MGVGLACLLMIAGFARAADEPDPARTTYVIVRHAENQTSDPLGPLTPEGRERAERFAEMLASMDVAGVYATPFKRTQRTGQPVAGAFGLEVGAFDPRRGPEELTRLGDAHAGRTIVVVGHSNTVPDLVRALGGDPGVEQIDEAEYDRLYIVTTIEGHAPVCHLLRY